LMRLYVVAGVTACPRCVEWRLLHSNPSVWATLGSPPEPAKPCRIPKGRVVRQGVHQLVAS